LSFYRLVGCLSPLQKLSSAAASVRAVPQGSLTFTFVHLAGTKIPPPRLALGSRAYRAGNNVLSKDYFVRQVTALLRFAKETTNPQLAAVLIEKAADLKSQIDESSTTPEPSPQASHVQPETSLLVPNIKPQA
jgi:hypothetical protein